MNKVNQIYLRGTIHLASLMLVSKFKLWNTHSENVTFPFNHLNSWCMIVKYISSQQGMQCFSILLSSYFSFYL